MNELVVLSSRGGAGRTTLVASLASLLAPCITVDCDLHAGKLALLTPGADANLGQVQLRGIAQLDNTLCRACGECESACRFGAIRTVNGQLVFDERRCEGCFACALRCRSGAIHRAQRPGGTLRCRQTAIGSLFHVERAAEHDSCERIVDLLKTTGRKSALSAPNSTTLVNAPPGFGCTVFTALAGANAVLIVTEPSPSMVHDVRRLLLLVNALCLKAGIVINKCDLWPDAALEIGVAAEAFGAEVVATLPFDEGIPALLAQSRLPVELSGEFLRKLESIAAWVGRQNVAD